MPWCSASNDDHKICFCGKKETYQYFFLIKKSNLYGAMNQMRTSVNFSLSKSLCRWHTLLTISGIFSLLVWSLTTQSQLLRSCLVVIYLTKPFLSRHGPLLTSTCTHYFPRNWQLSFLNQRKGANVCITYFMINLHERILPDLVAVGI